MPEFLLILATAPDQESLAPAFQRLNAIEGAHHALYVAGLGKIAAPHGVKTINVERGYPAFLEKIRTLSRWAGADELTDPRLRDAFDLFCLRQVADQADAFDFMLLLRGAVDPLIVSAAMRGIGAAEFTIVPNLVHAVDLRASTILFRSGARFVNLLDAALDLYETGASYGFAPYDIEHLLAAASEASEVPATAGRCVARSSNGNIDVQ